ncbi:hypothetical protein [Glycomyces terrestris]|uniref:Uncharacterized protein n=1 Tax=Glycomyces terrestris TaxID=2493553 RepID=A0A426V500_9ACTN|nr:hypothetical protein [Glycomyces terrestris]RRS01989.1 hypothetical protein EIW28_04425 [Glycomyces terrestris]
MGQVGHGGIDWAGVVLDRGRDAATEREGRAAVAGWQRFARRYRLEFRAELEPEDCDGETAEVLTALGALGFPVACVRGWTRGAWDGRTSFGFCAVDATAAGSRYQLRFNAAPLRLDRPDTVQHRLLDGDSALAATWHPERHRYAAVALTEPPRPQARHRGRLGQAVDRLFRPVPRRLHTADPRFAAALAAEADRSGLDLFRWSWAAKGGWLTTWRSDAAPGDDDRSRARFMDFLPALAACLERTQTH